MNIILTSKILTVTKILKKTKAKMFENLKVGDKILIYVPIEKSGRKKRTYATYITTTNCETGEQSKNSFNELPRLLNNFDLTENTNWFKCDHCEHQYLAYGCESACGLQSKGLDCKFKERVNEL